MVIQLASCCQSFSSSWEPFSVVITSRDTPDTFIIKYYIYIKLFTIPCLQQFWRSWTLNLQECVCETDSKRRWVHTSLCQEKRWLTFSEHLLCARHFPECFTRINLTHTCHPEGTIILILQLRKVLHRVSITCQCNNVLRYGRTLSPTCEY